MKQLFKNVNNKQVVKLHDPKPIHSNMDSQNAESETSMSVEDISNNSVVKNEGRDALSDSELMPTRQTRRGRTVRPPSYLKDYQQ